MSVIVYDTSNLPEDLPPNHRHWVYNSFDCCVPHEVHGALVKDLQRNEAASRTLAFTWRLVPMALAMMRRGIAIDTLARNKFLHKYSTDLASLESHFTAMTTAVCDKALNPRSPTQLIDLFYRAMKIRPIFSKAKGSKGAPTVNRDALEKLQIYFHAKPIASTVLAIRDVGGMMKVLKSGIDDDGRMRFSFNPAGTETGRWSSSKNPIGGGTNGQNITEELREIFVSDPGWRLCNVDLEQAESRALGYLAGDREYIAACESSDLHTTIAVMLWPDIMWPDDATAQRLVAEEPYYRHFSRRDTTKRLGHASNYLGQPPHLSRILRVEQSFVEEFQSKYFARFSGIKDFHHHISRELIEHGHLVTPFGRQRQFFGRLMDEGTLKEAVAFLPQSTVVDYTSTIMAELWEDLDLAQDRIRILNHGHDAVLFQYREDDISVIDTVRSYFDRFSIPINDRKLHIPVSIATGYNWAKYTSMNPAGLGTKLTSRPTLLDTHVA